MTKRHGIALVAIALVLAASTATAQPGTRDRLIRVRGRVVCERLDNRDVPVGGTRVSVRNMYESGMYAPLEYGYTDADGYFDFTFLWIPDDDPNPNLRVVIEPKSTRITVYNYDGTDLDVVSIETETYWDYPGSDLQLGWLEPAREQDHAVWHALVVANRLHDWFDDTTGDDLPAFILRTNYGNDHLWLFDDDDLNVGSDHLWREASLARGYARLWLAYHGSGGPFGMALCNDVCDPGLGVFDCFHCDWCNENPRVAWVEGFCAYVADRFTADYEDRYGYAPLYPADYEDLDTCGDDTWDEPNATEGFFAALLRDIADITMDVHPHYADYRDVVSLGSLAVFAGIRDAASFTPVGFLQEMVVTYPAYSGLLWETGMNCGLDCDVAAPGLVTGLASPSHPIGDPSSDSTPTFTWTRADDDASGIAGYSVRVEHTALAPDTVLDIEDVTTWTSTPLTPGTWYFTIRTRDRAGRWSSSYRQYGPFVVSNPLPADLVFYEDVGWDYPLVPSNDDDNSAAEAHVSAYLFGNATATYWNLHGWNVGESIADWSFRCYVHIDGVPTNYAIWSTIGPDEGFYGANLGPILVRGGRHAFTGMIDELDQIPESDETNNLWGRQFVWTGRTLSTGTPIVRDAPPGHTDGWDEVTSGTLWYDCDGLSFTSTGNWTAVYIQTLDVNENLDCRLHAESTGAQNGYAANLGASYRSAGWLDAVVANRRVLGQQDYDVGVVNLDGAVGQYRAWKIASEGMTFGDSTNVILGEDRYLRLVEFNVTTADTGWVTMAAEIDAAASPIRLAWLAADFTTGGLDLADREVATDAQGRAAIDAHIGSAGYNCVIVFRNPADGAASEPVGLEVTRTPPDLLPYAAAGWHSPLVPRAAADGAPAGVALPDTLHGNAAQTYMNLASRNASPTASGSSRLRARLDGEDWFYINYASYAAQTTRYYNSGYGRTVRGGRHTLDMCADADSAVAESREDNNIYGEQYVWSPLALDFTTTPARAAPPLVTGGWDRITSGESRWYDCDGLRLPQSAGTWWRAVAVMPAAGADVDLRLHAVQGGAKNGFRTNLGLSAWPAGESDFVLVNFNRTAQAPYDYGVLDFGDGGGYTAQAAASLYLGASPGTFGPYAMPANAILHLREFRLAPAHYTLQLESLSGSVDWGLSVYPGDDPYLVKSEVLDGGAAWLAAAGANESVTFEIAELAYYGVAVWKRGAADLPLEGTYRLILAINPVGVDDGGEVPVATRLIGAFPNPFNPRTTVAFETASAGPVLLAIHDLTGARVRVLATDALPAGRHEASWDGTDERGRRVASGVYVARLVAGPVRDVKKVVMVQ